MGIYGQSQLDRMGFQKLSETEKSRLAEFLIRITSSTSLSDVALDRMSRDGWSPVAVLGTVRRGSTELIVVEISPLQKWAIEAPIAGAFPKGRYWARTSILNGVDDIIDARGREHSLLLNERFEIK